MDRMKCGVRRLDAALICGPSSRAVKSAVKPAHSRAARRDAEENWGMSCPGWAIGRDLARMKT